MSKTNEEIAETIKAQMGDNPDITAIQVKGHLLQLHVSEKMFHKLSADRERGRKIVLVLLEQMKKLTGLEDVVVWVYSDKIKGIEGTIKSLGWKQRQFPL